MGGDRPRTRWTRIGVLDHVTSEFKPLLGFQASKDGGLILTPSYVTASTWESGRAELPSGAHLGLAGSIRRETVRSSPVAPKLHYHKSGWLTANLTGRPNRGSLKCLPLDRLDGAQVFSCSTTNLPLIDTREIKRGDVFSVAHNGWPSDLSVGVFVHQRNRILGLPSQLDGPHATAIVQHRSAETVVDLAGHGLDLVLAFRFWGGGLAPDESGRPNVWLFGFDSRATVLDGTNDALGVWTENDNPKPIILAPPGEAPFDGPPLLRPGRPDVVRVFRRKQ